MRKGTPVLGKSQCLGNAPFPGSLKAVIEMPKIAPITPNAPTAPKQLREPNFLPGFAPFIVGVLYASLHFPMIQALAHREGHASHGTDTLAGSCLAKPTSSQ